MTHEDIIAGIELLAKNYSVAIKTAIEKNNMGEIFALFFQMKEANAELEAARKKLGAEFERFNKSVLPEFLDTHDTDMVRVPELGRSFYINTQYSATITDTDSAYEWLRGNGGEDLIRPSVNAGSLKSFVLSKIEEENVQPPEDAIKINSYRQIGSSKYTQKN